MLEARQAPIRRKANQIRKAGEAISPSEKVGGSWSFLPKPIFFIRSGNLLTCPNGDRNKALLVSPDTQHCAAPGLVLPLDIGGEDGQAG